VLDILDVVIVTDIAFRNGLPIIDSTCTHAPGGRTDVNCDGLTNVFDVVLIVEVAFRGGDRSIFCEPCRCNPYPSSCPPLIYEQ